MKKTSLSIHQIKFFIIILIFFIGTGLIIQSPTFSLSQLPGDLGDTRFNIYILEHFFQWISHPTTNYWDAAFYYPYPSTIAFSDSLLGSAPIYAVFRLFGISRESAFQAWYVLGYILNYAAAAYVLRKLKLSPLAAASGAFFFAFGLPVLAQENHVQLLYRFCIPLAGYCLWQLAQQPRLSFLLGTVFFAVWQFYLAIYTGYFLVLLLICMVLVLPWLQEKPSLSKGLSFWPNTLQQAWVGTSKNTRLMVFGGILISFGLLLSLLYPYYKVSTLYHFTRSMDEIKSMLPRWQSYFLADRSLLWAPISAKIQDIPLRHEHQLFPGIAVLFLFFIGLVWRFETKNRKFALLYLTVFGIMVLLTLNVNGFSVYGLLLNIPGINSIRAVTRLQLVLMWPLAVICAVVLDGLVKKKRVVFNILVVLLVLLLLIESFSFTHITFSKQESQMRVAILRDEIKKSFGNSDTEPILFLGSDPNQPWYVTELDAMLAAQELSIPTLNGYSGNLIHGFGLVTECVEVPNRILKYMRFMSITDEQFYLDMIKRVKPIRLNNCDPKWIDEYPNGL